MRRVRGEPAHVRRRGPCAAACPERSEVARDVVEPGRLPEPPRSVFRAHHAAARCRLRAGPSRIASTKTTVSVGVIFRRDRQVVNRAASGAVVTTRSTEAESPWPLRGPAPTRRNGSRSTIADPRGRNPSGCQPSEASGLDRATRAVDVGRQHRIAVARGLLVEELPARHRDEPRGVPARGAAAPRPRRCIATSEPVAMRSDVGLRRRRD